MGKLPYSHLEKGAFLIASPELEQGLFKKAVILLCEHSPAGSFGLIVNKPFELEVPEEIVDLKHTLNPHISLRAGGPMQMGQMMLLHTSPDLPEQTLEICPNVFLGGDVPFLKESMQNKEGPSVHLCFGFAGWATGQLEREFLKGDWFLHPASARHVFETPAADLWKTILREMGGKFASMSMIPSDLSLN